jgi:uncharacterized membrane-anchored protein YitT (DUF2179 family)
MERGRAAVTETTKEEQLVGHTELWPFDDGVLPEMERPESRELMQGIVRAGGYSVAALQSRKERGTKARIAWKQHAGDYTLLLVGSLLIAVSFNMFLNPNQVASGGVSGISIITEELFGWEPAITQWALNIPLFFAGMYLLGGEFGLKTLVGTIVLPLLVLLTRGLPSLTHDLLLATIYGGMLIGLGLGLVFRARGSTGGLDVAAQIVHKYTSIGLGVSVALLDGLVIMMAAFVFSPEKALFALIGLFVTTKTIGIVQLGFSYSKVAFIITEDAEAIREAILFKLDRGLTNLQATGGYSGESRTVIMVVVSQTEVTKLKELVRRTDPKAFVILSDTNEVLGEGFKRYGTV